jgi:hypothetical protein
MQGIKFIKGRLVGPRNVELDEPVLDTAADVEVIVRTDRHKAGESLSDFLRHLPPGKRSREDIDSQIREERDSWSERG